MDSSALIRRVNACTDGDRSKLMAKQNGGGRHGVGAMAEALEQRTLLAADLTLRVAFSGRTFQPGATFHAKVTVRNIGDSAAGAFATTLALSNDKVFGNADDIPMAILTEPGGLAAGAKDVESVVLTVPSVATNGKHFLVGKVDSGNAVAESNESNNVFVSSRVVRVGPKSAFPVAAPIIILPLGQLVAPLAPSTAFTTLGNVVLLSPEGTPPFSVFGLTPVIPPIESPISFPITNNPFPQTISPAPFGSLPATSPVISPTFDGLSFAALTSPASVSSGIFFDGSQIRTTAV
ncbi:MAG: Peptidase and in, kexin, sedolisin [Phycisphaerales bacterium]|nr:Peptidase and in, kexin, sedolisin [Phycisphaerales bacterium]